MPLRSRFASWASSIPFIPFSVTMSPNKPQMVGHSESTHCLCIIADDPRHHRVSIVSEGVRRLGSGFLPPAGLRPTLRRLSGWQASASSLRSTTASHPATPRVTEPGQLLLRYNGNTFTRLSKSGRNTRTLALVLH
jgi:hypothetical protein